MSNSLQDDWRQHDWTRKLRNEAEKLLEIRLMNLLSVCAGSTDPKVTAKLAEYREQQTLVVMLKGNLNERTSGSGQGSTGNAGEQGST